MFVTCHITFGQLSNFVGASLEVTRTIRNNKLHFTWGCSILLLKKKRRGPWDRIPFFLFQWFWYFFKCFNSNHNLPSYSLFSKYFFAVFLSWCTKRYRCFFVAFFFSLLLSRVTRFRARLALASVSPKNADKLRTFSRTRPP